MKTILVPTDFSENASKALDYAIELARKENAKIILMHSYRISYTNSYTYLTYDVLLGFALDARRQSNNNLKTLAQKIEHAGGVEYECLSKENFAVDAILETIEENNVDLVIMGTKGAGRIREFVLGSNTAKIIEKASCPVIAIPEHTSIKDIKNITYATDYHPSDFNFIKQLLEIARPFNARINFLHISSTMNEGQQDLMKMFINEVRIKTHYTNISYALITGKDVVNELEHYIKTESPDLIVMSTHQRDLMDKIFNTSITKKLVHRSEVPLMAFHYNKEEVVAF